MTPNQASDLSATLKNYMERICAALERIADSLDITSEAREAAEGPLSAPAASPAPAVTPSASDSQAPPLSHAEFKAAVMAANERLGTAAVQAAFAALDKGYRFIKDVRPEHYRAVIERLA